MAVKLKVLLVALLHFYWVKLSSCQGSVCTVESQKYYSTTGNLESIHILNLTLCDLNGDNELRVTISTLMTGFGAHDTEDRQIMCRDECTSQSITDHTLPLPGNSTTTHDDDFSSPTETPPSMTSELTSECQCTQAGMSDEGTSTTPQTQHQTQCDTISGVLGALVGLLLLLLLVVTTGWAWTYWTMKKRIRSLTTDNITENQSNPCYEGVDQPTLAIYETIPSHPTKTEGGQYYDVLDRKQLSMTADPDSIIAEADKMISYSKLVLGDDDIKFERNPAYTTTTPSDA